MDLVIVGGDAMKSERFNKLLDELDGCSLQTLKEKNARYAQNGDCLHNFRSGADIAGGTPAQACWGYLTKHLVALRDKVEKNDFSNREDFLEKCQDTINYIRFLWCIGNDDPDRENLHEMVDKVQTKCIYRLPEHKMFCTKHLDENDECVLCLGEDKCNDYEALKVK